MNGTDAPSPVRIVLRTGFEHDRLRVEDLASLFPNAEISCFQLGESFVSWPERMAHWPEPYVMFLDAKLPPPSPMVLRRLAQRMNTRTAQVLTLDTPLRQTLLESTSGPQLCSGLTVIARPFFLAAQPANDCASLEGALSFAARALESAGAQPMIIRADQNAPEAAAHLAQLLRAQRDHLARDFEVHGATLGAALSRQFAVRAYGIPYVPQPQYEDWQHPPVRFSILCPAYKSRFIDDLLDSVEAQTYPHWELLLRVDGPPEPDRAILCERLQNRMHRRRIHWTEQENAGTAATRARLAEEATGDFILFVDDDDQLAPETLACFAEALDQHPEADAVRGGSQLFGLIDRYLPPRKRYTYHGLSADLFEVNQPFAVRRSTLEALGGFEGDAAFGGVGEDTDLLLRLEQAGVQTLLIDAPLYYRRISPLNQTLLFQGDQFAGHVRTLAGRRLPPGWSVGPCRFAEQGAFVHQTLAYTHPASGMTVYAPTEFFNFHTLGADLPQAVVLEWERDGTTLTEQEVQDILAQYETTVPVWLAVCGELPENDRLHNIVDAVRRDSRNVDVIGQEVSYAESQHAPLPWLPGPTGWQPVAEATRTTEATVPDWREAGVCGVAAAWDVYSPGRGMIVCPAEGAAGFWHGPLDPTRPREARLLKLGQYRRGHFRTFCAGCPHCPDRAKR